jgi:hypothetical protein
MCRWRLAEGLNGPGCTKKGLLPKDPEEWRTPRDIFAIRHTGDAGTGPPGPSVRCRTRRMSWSRAKSLSTRLCALRRVRRPAPQLSTGRLAWRLARDKTSARAIRVSRWTVPCNAAAFAPRSRPAYWLVRRFSAPAVVRHFAHIDVNGADVRRPSVHLVGGLLRLATAGNFAHRRPDRRTAGTRWALGTWHSD